MNQVTYDLSGARRIKRLLQTLRNSGAVVFSLLLFLTIADQRLLMILVVYGVANAYLPKGRWLAPIVLAVITVGLAVYLEFDYERSLERINTLVKTGEYDVEKAALSRKFTELTRLGIWVFLGFSGLYIAAVVLVIIYSGIAVRPQPVLNRLQRVALRLKLLRAKMTTRAIFYGVLSITCALIALGPGLVSLGGMILHIQPSGWVRTVRDWDSDLGWPRILLSFSGAIATLLFFIRAKRWASLPVSTARSIDPRPPILLLRSFEDDTTPLNRTTDAWAFMRSMVAPTWWTLEETIEQSLAAHGPLIAIGRPGETVPPAGAAREYVSNDSWRARITEHITEAGIIVVILGKTEGLEFEYRTLGNLDALRKLIVVFPPVDASEITVRWQRFCLSALPQAETSLDWNPSQTLAAFFEESGTVGVATCRWRDDEDCYRLALDRCLAAVQKR